MVPVVRGRRWGVGLRKGPWLCKGKARVDVAITKGARRRGLTLLIASELAEARNAVVSSLDAVGHIGAVEETSRRSCRWGKAENAKRRDKYQAAHRPSLNWVRSLLVRNHAIERMG